MAAARGRRRSFTTRATAPKARSSNTTSRIKPKKNSKITLHRLGQLVSAAVSATAASHSFLCRRDLHLLPSQTLTLESQISSASLSLSALQSLLNSSSISHFSLLPSLSYAPRTCWFNRLLSSSSFSASDPRWTNFFRMSKSSFTLLLRLLTPSLTSLLPIPPDYALAAALFRLGHGASFKALSRRFALDSATSCRVFYTVCKSIHDRLGHLFEFKSDINRIVVGFGWISLPNCCGILGFDRFRIDGDLLGKSGSLLVQALVDSEGRILDVSAGWPSTMKPDKILRQSKLFLGIDSTKEYLNGQSLQLNDLSSIPQYILGENCFPLLPWLITPYSESETEYGLSSMEAEFNSLHRRGMELLGTTFRRVRERWRLLSSTWKEECIEFFPFVIVACCLLHNFLIKCSEEFQFLEEDVEYLRDQELAVFEGKEDQEGRRIRDALALHLTRVRLGD